LDGPRDYLHEDIGFNYRISNLHAALGLAQVEKANYYRSLRINNNTLYKKYLAGCEGIVFQNDQTDSLNCNWMNAVMVIPEIYGKRRDDLVHFLKENNIETRNLFNGMHRQKALQKFGCDCTAAYPVTNILSENGFYLPSGSALKENDIAGICDLIFSFKNK
jgi:perosamine synthetase